MLTDRKHAQKFINLYSCMIICLLEMVYACVYMPSLMTMATSCFFSYCSKLFNTFLMLIFISILVFSFSYNLSLVSVLYFNHCQKWHLKCLCSFKVLFCCLFSWLNRRNSFSLCKKK